LRNVGRRTCSNHEKVLMKTVAITLRRVSDHQTLSDNSPCRTRRSVLGVPGVPRYLLIDILRYVGRRTCPNHEKVLMNTVAITLRLISCHQTLCVGRARRSPVLTNRRLAIFWSPNLPKPRKGLTEHSCHRSAIGFRPPDALCWACQPFSRTY
jgi:hypothetical protein